MSTLSPDFDAYIKELTKRNRVSLSILVLGTLAAAAFFGIYLMGIAFDAPAKLIDSLGEPEGIPLQSLKEETSPLNLAVVCANLAVAAAARVWYTRQDKMTTLLTHALVLEGESETAIRLLLHKKMRK